MIDFAFKYKDQLNTLYKTNVVGNDFYKYWLNTNYWRFEPNFCNESDEWNTIERVSIFDGKIYGYFRANIDRNNNSVKTLSILYFYPKTFSIGFLKDLENLIKLIFTEYKFNKINFSVVVGNPAERLYDFFVKKYNGKIVGVYKDDAVLIDGNYYDCKIYEILKKDYIKT